MVIDKGTIKMHVPSQKGPHPHWRYTTGADGEIDLNEFDDAKGDTTSYAKFLLEGKTLYLAVKRKERRLSTTRIGERRTSRWRALHRS